MLRSYGILSGWFLITGHEGLMAQALEHEIDHLDGILYIDRMKEQGTLDTLTEIEASEAVEVGRDAPDRGRKW